MTTGSTTTGSPTLGSLDAGGGSFRLESTPQIAHLVLLRVRDRQGRLRAVLPKLIPNDPLLRALHGAQDRDGLLAPAQGRTLLSLLPALDQAPPPEVRTLLEEAAAGSSFQLEAIVSPRAEVLPRVAAGQGDLEDAEAFLALLDAGDVRAAEKIDGPVGERMDVRWRPQPYVIAGILNYFKVSPNRMLEKGAWDKIPLKTQNYSANDFESGGVRYAPGVRVRRGAYIGRGSVLMNQAFVNIGAYIAGEGVMIDSAARVASCAQIGKGVKFGAGSGIEGILEPAGRLPSIVEDHVNIGAMCEVAGIVGEGAVIASGVVMAAGKRIYDEDSGEIVPPLAIMVGEKRFYVPLIPPHRLAVGGSLPSRDGRSSTDAIILKPGDLRDGDTRRHFEKQGVLYA